MHHADSNISHCQLVPNTYWATHPNRYRKPILVGKGVRRDEEKVDENICAVGQKKTKKKRTKTTNEVASIPSWACPKNE